MEEAETLEALTILLNINLFNKYKLFLNFKCIL